MSAEGCYSSQVVLRFFLAMSQGGFDVLTEEPKVMLPGVLMRRGTKTLASMRTRDDGLALFEYVLVVALVSLVILTGLHAIGGRVNGPLTYASDQLDPSRRSVDAEKRRPPFWRAYARGGLPTEKFLASFLEKRPPICYFQWLERPPYSRPLLGQVSENRCSILNRKLTEPPR